MEAYEATSSATIENIDQATVLGDRRRLRAA
jgi:hypothetical protein